MLKPKFPQMLHHQCDCLCMFSDDECVTHCKALPAECVCVCEWVTFTVWSSWLEVLSIMDSKIWKQDLISTLHATTTQLKQFETCWDELGWITSFQTATFGWTLLSGNAHKINEKMPVELLRSGVKRRLAEMRLKRYSGMTAWMPEAQRGRCGGKWANKLN